MKRIWLNCTMLALAGLGAACGNPAIDPDATFSAKGQALDAQGQPLANVEVRLVKFFDDTRLLAPSTQAFFADTITGNTELGLSMSLVMTARTDATGTFSMEFKGADIAADGGYSTADGLVEGANLVLVLRDPADTTKRSGIFTYAHVFQQTDREWGGNRLALWASDATADVTNTLTSGLVKFSWNKIQRSTRVRNAYEVVIRGETENTPVLVIRCNEGDEVEGGCAQDPAQNTKLARFISAYSILAFYSDNNGRFAAYVQGNSPDYRFVSRFTVSAQIPDIRNDRDPVGIEGVWAVGEGADQDLLRTAAVDGNPSTRQAINNNATAIYAKLAPARITDAGVLNSLINNIAGGCIVLEFHDVAHSTLQAAKDANSGWNARGKFCGETGGDDELSALAGYDTTASDGIQAGWLRVRAVPDGAMAVQPRFRSVGEVAVFAKKIR